MTYDVLIRHTRPVPYGEGVEHKMEERQIEAKSEADAFLKIKHTSDDFIACIDSWHHEGIEPYSVETGDPEFFTDVHRPPMEVSDGIRRMG